MIKSYLIFSSVMALSQGFFPNKALQCVKDGIDLKADFLSSQKSLTYSLRIFVDNFSLLSPLRECFLLGSKFSTNLLFAASKCRATIQRQW